MGHKIVCLTCRKSFSKGPGNLHVPEKCQECGDNYVSYPQRFRPPGKSDLQAWKVVHFLYENGFIYQHILTDLLNYKSDSYAEYPENLTDAKEFVIKYQSQAIKHTTLS
ncbi:MAG: hypothetical protein JWQ85_3484 [Mucilaginibacter sp.]|nr:hypothetical protein [Mucilaginibacter sp.]